MKIRSFVCIIAFMVAVMFLAADVSAADVSELAEEYGTAGVSDCLPSDAALFLEENGITPSDPDAIMDLTPSTVISYIWYKLKNSAAAPLKVFSLILGAVLVSAAAGALSDTAGGKTAELCRVTAVLVCTALILPYMEKTVSDAAETMSCGSEFLLGYVPVMAGITAASGYAASAASYNAVVLIAAEIMAKAASDLLFPLLSLCMAMGIIDAINPTFSLSGITELIKKWTSVLMCFGMTIFTGMLSIQSIVGVSADTLGVKAAKFVVSNVIPVVGSAVADAYTTMRSGLGLLRGAAGAFGVIAVSAVLLPPVIESGLLCAAVSAGGAAAEVFGAKELGVLFRNTASVLSLITALLACFGVMFVISTVILMAAGMNCMT